MTTETREAKATLSAHGGTKLITREELALVPTPADTKTHHPVPHALVPDIIDNLVDQRGWAFAETEERYKFSISKDGAKMFGVTKVAIPDVRVDELGEFQMAIGFRNSHDKTFALRLAIGTDVFVCDNLMFTGDLQVRRIHTCRIDPWDAMNQGFDMIPGAANNLAKWFGELRELQVTENDGVAILAECVERKALPIFSFMEARTNFLKAYAGDNETILHGDTMWGVYQAVTEQFKNHNLDRTQVYSVALNQVMSERTGHVLQLN